ncbi:hypothetical protein Bpfe_022266 [Biomphalaria pfeifferi]|uniref:Uncharacterized protein n=1 Tax=Biomphalaria pfeifferi TaxID=112525 RepID=A0AAD8B6I7_BIOPF|nr:hypothetical protein Bpfe_022266 [Biomphalaria pfeifferi]
MSNHKRKYYKNHPRQALIGEDEYPKTYQFEIESDRVHFVRKWLTYSDKDEVEALTTTPSQEQISQLETEKEAHKHKHKWFWVYDSNRLTFT